MANPTINAISLCAGVGMLDEGVRTAFGYHGVALRTIAYAEWEGSAASQLIALMESGAVEPAPVWCGDFRQINASAFRGKVDCVIAGFPCQDLSVAGRRAGLDGKRSGLFFDVVDTADACGARYLVLENVAGIASATASVMDETEGELEERAAARVLGELADRGWNAEWITISASEVGASHGRARWFCFAWRVDNSDGAGTQRSEREEPCACVGCTQMGNTRLQHEQLQQRTDGAKSKGTGEQLANASDTRHEGRGLSGTLLGNWQGSQAYGSIAEFCGAPIFAPGPASDEWRRIISESPWLAPSTLPGVCMLVDGNSLLVDESRAHQLRQIGNGVVPLQAGCAFVELMRRANEVTA